MQQEYHSPAPALKKIDLTIARLRLLLAEISAREASLEEQRRTCREQNNKLVTFSLYGDSTLDSVLAMLGDVQERLTHIEATSRSLAAIRKRAEHELESLQLTKGIEEAKVLLEQLQARQASSAGADDALSPAEIQAEIARLRSLINEASERAARSIERAAGR
jgi:chromosome segregation ATPase